jgi:hypothetical protein
MLKIMIVIVILACMGPFFIKGPDGDPLMSLDDLMPATDLVPEAPTTTTVYKWQDENGKWHFSNDPRDIAGDQAKEKVEISSADINTMDEFKAPRQASSSSLSATTGAPGMEIPSGVTSVAPDKVAEMMDTVTNLQETVDQRKADLDQATGQ